MYKKVKPLYIALESVFPLFEMQSCLLIIRITSPMIDDAIIVNKTWWTQNIHLLRFMQKNKK